MKVIIVDDEPKAIQLLVNYLSHFADFELVATFRNGIKALAFLNTNQVDLAFLDINMPHINGLSLAKMVKKETKVVFTTAYSEHAVESYDMAAFDYLLKPISLERFSKTITRALETEKKGEKTSLERKSPTRIFIKSGQENHQVQVDEIEYLQKDGNYIYYMVSNKKIMARQSIQEALAGLPDYFLQIQKSYIVNFHKLTAVATDYVKIADVQLPIGPQFKRELLNRVPSLHSSK